MHNPEPWVKKIKTCMHVRRLGTDCNYLPYISILSHTHITQCMFFLITCWFCILTSYMQNLYYQSLARNCAFNCVSLENTLVFQLRLHNPASGRLIVYGAPCASHGPRWQWHFHCLQYTREDAKEDGCVIRKSSWNISCIYVSLLKVN